MLPFAVQGHRTAPDGLQSAAVIAVLFGVFVWLAVWTDIPLTEVGLLEVMVIAIAGPVWMSQAMSREAFLPYSYFACRSLLDFGIAGLLVLLNMSEIEYSDQFSKAAVLVTARKNMHFLSRRLRRKSPPLHLRPHFGRSWVYGYDGDIVPEFAVRRFRMQRE